MFDFDLYFNIRPNPQLELKYSGYPCVFSRLPNELIHHIFTLAAASCAETARSLSAVSRWARNLSCSHQLSSVCVSGLNFPSRPKETLFNIAHFLAYPKPSPNVKVTWIQPVEHIRHLILVLGDMYETVHALSPYIGRLLPLCQRLEQLAVPAGWFADIIESVPGAQKFFSTDDGPDLEINFYHDGGRTPKSRRLFTSDVHAGSYILLRRVTKLHLYQMTFEDADGIDLHLFPRLSHVLFEHRTQAIGTSDQLLRAVLAYKGLEMVVVVCESYGFFDEPQDARNMIGAHRASDSRVHVLDRVDSDLVWSPAGWKEGKRRGRSVWTRARSYTGEVYPELP